MIFTNIPKDIELFLPTEKNFVYIHDGSMIASYSRDGLMTEIKQERGSILDAMAKFEFIGLLISLFAEINNNELISKKNKLNVMLTVNFIISIIS